MRPALLFLLILLFAISARAASTPWTLEPEVRATGAVPDAYVTDEGSVWIYHCAPGGLFRADVLEDGSLAPAQRVTIRGGPGGCDPTLVRLANGTFRLYYKVPLIPGPGGPDQAKHTIHAATATDDTALSFAYDGMVVETRSDGRHVSVPDAIVLPDGRVRLYYTSGEAVKSHVSTDASALVFEEEPGQRMAGQALHVDPEVVRIGDTWVLFVSTRDRSVQPPSQFLAFGVGDDPLDFTFVGFLTKDLLGLDPTYVALPDGGARVYFGTMQEQIRSVVADGAFQPLPPAPPTPSSPSPATPPPTATPSPPTVTTHVDRVEDLFGGAGKPPTPTPTPQATPTPPADEAGGASVPHGWALALAAIGLAARARRA